MPAPSENSNQSRYSYFFGGISNLKLNHVFFAQKQNHLTFRFSSFGVVRYCCCVCVEFAHWGRDAFLSADFHHFEGYQVEQQDQKSKEKNVHTIIVRRYVL